MFCETRWSQKYKSISVFNNHFTDIISALQKLSLIGNNQTRKTAFQLHATTTTGKFVVAVALIAKYSAILEPVVNALQSKALDLLQCSEHIRRILGVIKSHRNDPEQITRVLMENAKSIAEKCGLELLLPRIVDKQKHRSNPPASNKEEYWRRSLIIPYLDSLVSSLERRFSEDHSAAFSLLILHPQNMMKMTIDDFEKKSKEFELFYNLQRLNSETELWYSTWSKRNLSEEQLQDIKMADLVKEADIFYPETKKALLISLALPCTTCTVERSFSTLRRVKSWLRSTMTENRLNGLCLMSVHREFVIGKEEKYLKEIFERFAKNPRKLVLV